MKGLDAITTVETYPSGSLLFTEGQPTRGVFVISSGRVKLTSSSGNGKVMVVRVVEAGELIGLPGTISGNRCGATAEIIRQARVSFISRAEFIQFLRQHADAALRVARLLIEIYESPHLEVRAAVHSQTVSERLARFILDWSVSHARSQDRLLLPLRQEEIATMIRASRETVSRALAKFKKEEILAIKGALVVILNRTALERIARI